MIFSLLALTSAALYGAADFIGGLTSRRADTIAVVAISQLAGLVMLLVLLPVLPATTPARHDWLWGAAAGLTGGIGVALLYRALAVGIMAVVAPVTALCAVAVPVAVAVFLGERPGLQASIGMLIAVIAIVLVSQQDAAPFAGNAPSGIGLAVMSGVAIGLFFLALARTASSAGLWPLVAARVVSVSLFSVPLLVRPHVLRMPAGVGGTIMAGGVVDMLANVFYLLASRAGPLTIVVTLSSLYPASTVVLARAFLGERVTGRQWVGVACALIAIVVIVSAAETAP